MGRRGLSITPKSARVIRRASPLFLILLLVLAIPLAHASQYVGYSNNQSPTCGSSCQQPVNNYGIGETLQSPVAGSLVSVGVFVATGSPGNVVILTMSTTPTSFTIACSPGTGTCGRIHDNQGPFTVQDREAVTLTPNSFNTILLGTPVTVTNGQFVAVIFTGCAGTNCLMTNAGTGIPSALDTCFSFGTNTPALSATFNTHGEGDGGDPNCLGLNTTVIGGTFQASLTPIQGATQCYGNCGSPPVTVVNTNSTHLINFNQSITILYEFQSNLNGFILNETLNVAKNYNNGEGMTLGIYTVDPSCPVGVTPFSPQCPGFLQQKTTYQILFKGGGGTNRLIAGSIPISNGQWAGVAVSGFFKGLDLNDTNTGVQLFQTNGQVPTQIASTSQLSASSLVGIQLWINGNFATSTGGTQPSSGTCTPACYLGSFTSALGGGVFGGLVAFGILFGIIGGGLMYATRQHDAEGHIKGYAIPTWFLGIIAILLLIGMSAAGALPAYIPLVIIALVAWLFASSIWKNRNEQGGTGAAM